MQSDNQLTANHNYCLSFCFWDKHPRQLLDVPLPSHLWSSYSNTWESSGACGSNWALIALREGRLRWKQIKLKQLGDADNSIRRLEVSLPFSFSRGSSCFFYLFSLKSQTRSTNRTCEPRRALTALRKDLYKSKQRASSVSEYVRRRWTLTL